MFTVLLAIAVLFIRFDPDLARLARSASADLRAAFAAITDFGKSDWILIPTGIIGLALAALNLRRFARPVRARLANLHGDMCFIFVTIAVTGTSISLIKNTIGRARPKHLDTYGAYAFDVAAFTSDFASFPSGHSTTFGALCACLCLLAPRMMWLWLAFGILGGVSRMMVNAHYASDVLAGLTAGALGTILFARWLSNRNILFRPVRAGHALMPVRKRPWF
ncbi:MAG: phosphatase PAP2 family protein [Pseudomonadota bacterium]